MTSYTHVAAEHHLSASSISLTIQFANGTALDYVNLEGTTVLNVTESVVEVEANWFGDLAYVISIAGVHEDVGGSWEYWVNGERPSVAANKYQLEDGDSVLWKQPVPGETNMTGPLDSSIPIAIGATSFLGVGYLVIIYLRTKW